MTIRARTTIAGLALALLVFPTAAHALKPVAQPATGIIPPVGAYLGKLTVGAPLSYEGLTIYPLTTSSDYGLADYLTLDEAIKRQALVITELGEGAEVNTVLMENRGDRHVFIMAGEIIKGAKQDRTVQSDVLLPPKSGKKRISAFCVEHGRWEEKSATFGAAEQAVPNSVRRSAKGEKQQGKVWDSIARNQSRLKVDAPSQAAKDVYENEAVQRDLKPLEDRLIALPKRSPHMVGVLAAFGSRLVALDVFGDDTLMSRLYPKLLRSYAIDVIGDKPVGAMSAAQAKALVDQARHAPWTSQSTEGVGLGLEFRLKRHHGSALVYKNQVIHLDQFEGVVTPPAPARPDSQRNVAPPDLDIRQQRR